MDVQTAFILAQCISIGTGVIAVVIRQMKAMKMILFFEIIANLLASTNYLLLGGDAGAIVSVMAIIHSLVMFLYNRKEKTPPVFITVVFISVYLACSVYSVFAKNGIMELIPGVAAACFGMALMQKAASGYRAWGAVNAICWMVYDIYTMSYVMSVVHFGILISTVVAMVRLDGLLNFLKKGR